MDMQMQIFTALSAVGLVDTTYLVYHKIKGTDVACPFFPKEWCRTVQYSPQSKTFGIPNALAGFGMYALILIITILASHQVLPIWPAQALVAFGFLFSLYFTYVQAFVLKAFCTWCVISALNFLIMAIALIYSLI